MLNEITQIGYNYISEIFSLFIEMAPYLLLGFLFAGILYIFMPTSKVIKYLGGSNFRSVINAAIMGIPLPLCSCGVIPTGVSFYKNGASKGSSISFLISTPQTGIDSILVTYSLLGLPMAVIRPVVALVTGFLGGFFTNRANKNTTQKKPSTSAGSTTETRSKPSLKRMMKYAFVDFLQDIADWLLIGLALAGLIALLIPDNFFAQQIGNDLIDILILLVAAIPLYVCATASVPIAAVLLLKGVSPGAALVFLMAGPATNIATMTVLGKVFGRKTLIVYLASIICGAILFGTAINEFLPRHWFTNAISYATGEHQHHILPYWLKIASGVLLAGLVINGYIQKWLKNKQPNIETQKITFKDMNKKQLIVEGMTCNHCKMNVEKNLNKLEGIDNVTANPDTNEVVITGDAIDLEFIKEVVDGLGYTYKGVK